MAERVDVCIVGSGFGGSIAAWRLAELYRAAGVDPKNILVLERGPRFKHTDFKQSMYIGHLSNVYSLIQSSQGTGAQIVVANGVGGGSNLYLAASAPLAARDLRAPRPPPRRRPRAADVAEGDLAQDARPATTARAELGAARAAAVAGTRCRSRAGSGPRR